VEFTDDGEFLATGDKGGRVVIFSRDKDKDEVSLEIISLTPFCMYTAWKVINVNLLC